MISELRINLEAAEKEVIEQFGRLSFRNILLAGQIGALQDQLAVAQQTIRELEEKLQTMEKKPDG